MGISRFCEFILLITKGRITQGINSLNTLLWNTKYYMIFFFCVVINHLNLILSALSKKCFSHFHACRHTSAQANDQLILPALLYSSLGFCDNKECASVG